MLLLKSLLLLISAAGAIPASLTDPKLTSIPLAKHSPITRRDGSIDSSAFFTVLNKALAKYRLKPLPVSGFENPGITKRAGKTAGEPLGDDVVNGEDEEYYATLTIPRPGQTFTVDGDTGSADLFLPGPNCPSNDCTGTVRYDQKGSPAGNSTSVTYGSGDVTGTNYIDSVTIAGLTSSKQGLVSLTSSAGFSTDPPDELIGMGFSTIAESGFVTFFENLIHEGAVAAKEFGFYLGRAASGTAANSELTLGGRNASKFTGNVTQVSVTQKGYWQVVNVNSHSAGPTTKGQDAIDTGTTIVLAPTIAAEAIFAAIPDAYPLPLLSGSATIILFAYPCNTIAQYIPSIVFAGKPFAINPVDFNFGKLNSDFVNVIRTITSSSLSEGAGDVLAVLEEFLEEILQPHCIASLAAADIEPTENLYVIGDTFLKSWYSIYSYVDNEGADNPYVGFAKAVGN